MLVYANIVLVGLTVVFGLVPLWLTFRLQTRLPGLLKTGSLPAGQPGGVLILPCKGVDPGFRENVLALLRQDTPRLEYRFAVATRSDPAYDALSDILSEYAKEHPDLRYRLVVAGVSDQRAQKITNQLAALENLPEDTDFIVFVDSDIRPRPDFVRHLVAPLTDPRIGATTGFRWYHPPRPELGAILRSTWNAAAFPFLVDPERNFAWGGAMAIRRSVFEKAGIASALDRAASDDFPVTHGVRALGLEIRFVPECVAISHEGATVYQAIEFTNRQSIFSRIYHPPLWWSAAIGHSAANLLTLYGLYSLAAWGTGAGTAALLGAGCLLLVPLQMLNGDRLMRALRPLLPEIRAGVTKLHPYYVLSMPLTSLLSLVNTMYSLTTRRITWRGIQYELRSPTETVVIGAVASESPPRHTAPPE